MRTSAHLFSLLAAFLLPFSLFANVYVHGTVKRTNGVPVSNYEVRIETDSSAGTPIGCPIVHIKKTNQNGFYSDTLVCNAVITRIIISVKDCNGNIIRNVHTVPASQNVESNFIICDSSVNQCQAIFTWQTTGSSVHFFSGGSLGTSNTDSIISRLWTFGDGTSLSGNVINPDHQYNAIGSFTVCLKIKTASNCEKTICHTVILTSNTCVANFNWERIATTYRIRFNSTASMVAANDSIISRKWKFGDGDSLTGNVVSPEHTYAQPGTYNACLMIKTSKGCEKTICKLINILPTNVACEASFTYQLQNNTTTGFPVKFNSSASHTSPGDSIIVRRWTFGDGTSGTGVDPLHVYTHPGVYTVCFRIETAANCGDSVCKVITIMAPQPHCEAVFFSDSIPAPVASSPDLRYIKFNSSNSHGVPASDSIISRTWTFGDGTGIPQGNVASPIHGYAQTGTFTACLYILTQSGCRDTVCKPVIIRPIPVACQPRFISSATALSVVFNSSNSSIVTGDSIVERKWTFGDGTGAGNTVAVTHQFGNIGEYQICLTIRTKLGCVATWCKKMAVINQPGNCVPYFKKEQVLNPLKTMRFNSTGAYSQFPNDSILERKWEFGDGQTLTGNVVNPLHTYARGGTYTVCLKIRTARCDGRWCQNVLVRPTDSTNHSDSIHIVNLYPVPVATQLNAVVFSNGNNVAAELSIYDVYGVKKWAQNKILPQGNSTHNILTSQLANGPYIFRVTTRFGIKSKNFYKLN